VQHLTPFATIAADAIRMSAQERWRNQPAALWGRVSRQHVSRRSSGSGDALLAAREVNVSGKTRMEGLGLGNDILIVGISILGMLYHYDATHSFSLTVPSLKSAIIISRNT
jgi:hypothetical protein